MLKQAVTQPAQFSEAAILASRQVWLAGLGAAVVTRDWVQHEAGTVFKTLVKEGTAVESRAIRLVGDSIETSVKRANGMWRQTRHTVETTVRAYADTAVTLVKETLRRHDLDPKVHDPRRLRWRIDQWKNKGWLPARAAASSRNRSAAR